MAQPINSFQAPGHELRDMKQPQPYFQNFQQPFHAHPFQNGAPQAPATPAPVKPAVEENDTRLVENHCGTFPGGSYRISHRDANSLLTVDLRPEVSIYARPGAMVAMDPTMNLRGTVSFSWMKLFTRSEFAKSRYTGRSKASYEHGYSPQNDSTDRVLLAPSILGDIVAIDVNSNHVLRDGRKPYEWKVSREAFLAATNDVHNDYKSQGLSKAMFSGEGLFVYTFHGQGVLWVQGFGAICRADIAPGQKWIVDNNHLIAWNCKYNITRVASGGLISGISSREGLVCEFTGPGQVFYHTRKLPELAAHLKRAGR